MGGFLQCAGAVDGTHIPIIAPNESHADNHNRKWCYSILMQAVVDHDYRFTDVYIGWPGQVHDARVFDNSRIFRKTGLSDASTQTKQENKRLLLRVR